VPRYAVKLEVRANRPLTRQQIDELAGGRHEVRAMGGPRTTTLIVSLTIVGGDVAGALARALNVVLDRVPGEVRHAELTQLRRRPMPRQPRPRSPAGHRTRPRPRPHARPGDRL
jgi:hypothetical protein